MSNLPQALIPLPDTTGGTPPKPAAIWRKWTKKRAQYAPTLEEVKKISKKVKINVTRSILEDRRET